MTKILLVGGAGFIGSHCAVELLDKGYNIVIVDNYSNSDKSVVDKIKQVSKTDNNRITVYNINVCCKKDLNKVFAENNILAVIHFAAYKSVKESIDKPLLYYQNNIGGLIVLLECMKTAEAKHIIFSSSATVYGYPETLPLTETSKTNPINPYGRTKLMSEIILKDVFFNTSILRYFNPVGAHPSGLLGENPVGNPTNLFPYIYEVLKGKKPHLNIYGNDYDTEDGTCIRDYIHVIDLVKGHIAVLEKMLNDVEPSYQIYNLGTGTGYSVFDVVKMFEKITKIPIVCKIASRRSGDAPIVYSSCEKIKTEIGWEAEKDLKNMISDSWNWITQNI